MIVGNYELLTPLAHGGMAEAHVARSLIDGSVAVVKRLLPKYVSDPEFVEMFLDEGRVISSLHHPNVVAMKQFGFHDELPYLAMEYLHGVNLRTLARTHALRGKPFPLGVAFYIVESMLAGLHHAHEARAIDGRPMEITHRDVSPHNVVLTFDGHVKLIDFGIAKARGKSNETRSGELKGKVPYMSPEQVRSTRIDRRTDIYAAGVVLYELVVGRRPYVSNEPKLNEFNLMVAIANHQVVAPRAVQASVPPVLDQAIMRALAVAPDRRFQTAEEMRGVLATIGREIGAVGSAKSLSEIMVNTLGKRKPYAEALKTDAGVIELVTELERTKTKIDEPSDPNLPTPDDIALPMRPITESRRESAPSKDSSSDVDAKALSAVDKVIEDNRTRLRFQRPIDSGFRWGRLLDGIEGVLEIEFAEATLRGTALTAAVEALRNLGNEVSELHLIAAPIELAAQLGQRAAIDSIAIRGRCPVCQTSRTVIAAGDAMRRAIAHGTGIQCPTCATALADVDLDVLRALPAPVSLPTAPLPASATDPAPPTSAADESRTQSTPVIRRSRRPLVLLGIAAAVGVAGAVVAWRMRAAPEPLPSEPLSTRGHKADTEWVFQLERLAPSDNATLRATRALIDEIEAQLPPKLKAWSGAASDVEAVANLHTQLAGVVDLQPRPRSPARSGEYSVSRSALTMAIVHYSAIRSAWGLELANAPPTRATGVLVISAPSSSSIAAGDRLLSADGQRVSSVQSLTDQLLAKSQLELVVEHREQRTFHIKNSMD